MGLFNNMLGSQADAGNYIGGGMLGQNAAMNATQSNILQEMAARNQDNEMVGVFKILRAEDGFIVRCAPGEGYKQKTFVANDIDEAMDKAKVFLVTEALQK